MVLDYYERSYSSYLAIFPMSGIKFVAKVYINMEINADANLYLTIFNQFCKSRDLLSCNAACIYIEMIIIISYSTIRMKDVKGIF